MKPKILLTGSLILFLVLAAACTGTQEGEEPTPAPPIKGPALVMFYTDN